jgi:clan AA aspartic protease
MPMEAETMGRVMVEATVESLKDLWDSQRGLIPAEQVRRVTIPDALVDTGATLLSLPTSLIQQLGLKSQTKKRVRSSSGGIMEADMYEAVRLTIQGRSCTMDVMEIPDVVPALIGQLPLEHLDFVVDLRNRQLIGNPAHGGEHMYELY